VRVERDVARADAGLSLAQVHGAFDARSAEGLFGRETIVGATTDAEVLGFSAAAEGVGNDVIELEECRRFTTVPVGGDVRAAAVVAFEDEAAVGARDVP
jgi:hypothetical protein